MRILEIHTDGACSGNPGPAAVGFIIRENGKVIKEFSRLIGRATNNIAEYQAVIDALQEALILKADVLKIRTDSELLYNQVIGQYKVKNENIRPLHQQVQRLSEGFKKVEFKAVPREQNKEADKLASDLLKKEQAKMVAASTIVGVEESPSSEG